MDGLKNWLNDGHETA